MKASIIKLLNEALDEDALNSKRRRWLEFHDQKTGGIMGLLPLVKGLPVRLTEHVDRGLGLFKNSKCTIHGWTLSENEAPLLLRPARLSFRRLRSCKASAAHPYDVCALL